MTQMYSVLSPAGVFSCCGCVVSQSDVVLLMTCSVREGAEQKIWNRLEFLKSLKLTRQRLRSSGLPPVKIGILGEST